MEALAAWLYLLGALRLSSVYFGFFNIWGLRTAVYSLSSLTEVHGRTFGIWTLVTCTLCFMCARDLNNKGLFTATHLSFLYALLHFTSEYLIFKSMTFANFSTLGLISGVSTLWMLLWRLQHAGTNKVSSKKKH